MPVFHFNAKCHVINQHKDIFQMRPRNIPLDTKRAAEDEAYLKEFAKRLGKTLDARQMSASDLARAIWGDIVSVDKNGNEANAARNRDRISVYLSGRGFPNRKNLAKMAAALSVKVEDLAPDLASSAPVIPSSALLCDELSLVMLKDNKAVLKINKVIPQSKAMEILNIITNIQD